VKPAPEEKQVRFQGEKSGLQAKKGFFTSIVSKETEWNVNCLP
jgi:hypothetical protein